MELFLSHQKRASYFLTVYYGIFALVLASCGVIYCDNAAAILVTVRSSPLATLPATFSNCSSLSTQGVLCELINSLQKVAAVLLLPFLNMCPCTIERKIEAPCSVLVEQ